MNNNGSRARMARRHTAAARRLGAGLLMTLLLLVGAPNVFAATPAAGTSRILPVPPAAFAGKIGRTAAESIPAFPARVRAPDGAPNVLLIMTDDVGFAAASTFGGPTPTPNLDQLAAQGLTYNQFHSAALCSPTRAALLTGRNHHMVATGNLVDVATGYPGYWSMIPDSAATIAQVLTLSGYNTAMFGKHHNVPRWEQSAAGPFDDWPTGLGFEYFFGFIGGDADQWQTHLYRGITQLPSDPPNQPLRLLDARLADDAIRWLHNQNAADPDKPFFVYYAPGSTHAPHQAPPEWIAKFKGQFDQGWDVMREQSFARQKARGLIPANTKLTPRPAQIEAWDALSDDQRRVYAHMMEVYAAQLAYQDAQIGRVLDELERMGERKNTLVLFIEGDNGASAEAGNVGMSNELGRLANRVQDDTPWLLENLDRMGGPKTYENYPVGWAWAMDTPFQWTKQVASHLGGTRNALVVSWPAQIHDHGQLRTQFGHVVDIMPTILAAAHITAPEVVQGTKQQRIDGVSLLPTFDDPKFRAPRTQYFEIMGNLGIYKDGWLANTTPRRMPWQVLDAGKQDDRQHWELYHLDEDYSQSNDLAEQMPDKLKQMQALFWAEAARNQVLPIHDRFGGLHGAHANQKPRSEFTYWGSDVSVAEAAAPSFAARSFSLTADVDLARGDDSGVLVANGSWFGGWSFYLKHGQIVALEAVSLRPDQIFRIASAAQLAAGHHLIRFDFTADGGIYAGGTMKIFADDQQIAEGRIGRTIALPAGLGETFDIGRDTAVPVTDDYATPTLPASAIRSVHVKLGEPMMRRPQTPAAGTATVSMP